MKENEEKKERIVGFRPETKYAALLDRISNETGYTVSQFMNALLSEALDRDNLSPVDRKILVEVANLAKNEPKAR